MDLKPLTKKDARIKEIAFAKVYHKFVPSQQLTRNLLRNAYIIYLITTISETRVSSTEEKEKSIIARFRNDSNPVMGLFWDA